MHFDPDLREAAAECGLNSFIIMSGALDGSEFDSELLSYEAPWGIGYGVARFKPKFEGMDNSLNGDLEEVSGACEKPSDEPLATEAIASPSLPVRLAFAVLEDQLAGDYLSKNGYASPTVSALLNGLNPRDREFYIQLTEHQAGCFVSFHKGSDLRGCIGTITATCDNVFKEICQNTVSAATCDPRFPEIQIDEVKDLHCSVDILGKAEAVSSINELDAKRYGVIVSKGFHRGVLLPDLEGVDTPEEQIAIALRKASISPKQKYNLERFEVLRYE
jgi:AmmeMemoRadiSam system protein A